MLAAPTLTCPDEDQLVTDPMDPEVEGHLGTCAECRGTRRLLLVYNAPPALPDGVSIDLPAELAAQVERDLGALPGRAPTESGDRFVVEGRRWVGTSDRGLLYQVFDRSGERFVGLKVLHQVDRAGLESAARALEALRHPNVARWLDVLPGEPLRATRDLVEGETLDVALETAPRPRILRWLGVLASAVSALHGAGVVHGGLGPSNVRVDPRGRLVVLDAGLGGLPDRSPWRAPELAPREATEAGDWYAVGRIFERYAPQVVGGPSGSPYSVGTVLQRMLDPDPTRRPAGLDVLAALLLEQGQGGLEGTRYQIRDRIDRGGMGELFRAWDPVLRREVALKRVAGEKATSAVATRRFLAEARVAAQLQHPNIVPVHELDHMPDGSPFFTMKLIDGRELSAVLEELHAGGDVGLTRVVEDLVRLCDAVAYAHSRGVVHMDLKPKNVLVGRFGELQLIDWGAARVLPDAQDSVDVDPGDAPRIAGTPHYMAPEQEEGRVDDIGRHTDVFALGAILWQVVHGAPWRSGGSSARPPVQRDRRELASIAAKALSADPAGRYPDAEVLGRDLRAWLGGERVQAHGYDLVDLLEQRTRGRRAWILLVLVSVLSVGTIGWFAYLGWHTSELARHREIERQGMVLAEQARFALVAGDRVEAEHRAASAVAVAGTPEGRGLLARLGRAWYPRSAGPCAAADGGLDCPTPDGVWRWTPDPAGGASETWTCGATRQVVRAVRDGKLKLLLVSGEGPEQQLADTPTGDPVCDPAGLRLAFARNDEVEVWKTSRLEEDAILEGHDGGVMALAWSHDGRRLATADGAGTVRLWDPAKGRELARLPDHGDVSGLAFASRSATLLVAGDPPRAWDLRPEGAVDRVEAMVPLARIWWGKAGLATLDRQGTWRAWDPTDGRFTGDELPARERATLATAPSPDGLALAAVGADGGLDVWERSPMRPRWSEPEARATVVAWSGSGEVWTGGADGLVRRWDALGGRALDTLGEPGAAVADLRVDGDLVVVRRVDGAAEVRQGDRVRRLSGVSAVDAAGGHVALGEEDGDLVVVGSREPIATLGRRVLAVALSPAGTELAAVASDHVVRAYVLEGAAWVERASVILDLRSAPGLAFSDDGATLAVIGVGSDVELWDTSTLRKTPAELVGSVEERYGPRPGSAP